MILTTQITTDYYETAKEYGLFHSISKYWSDKFYIGLIIGKNESQNRVNKIYEELSKCGLVYYIPEEIIKPIKSHNREQYICAQAGEFLNANVFSYIPEDEVILQVDADMILQRKLDSYEYESLYNLTNNQLLTVIQDFPPLNLREVLNRKNFNLQFNDKDIQKYFPGQLDEMKEFTASIMAGTKSTFKTIRDVYSKNIEFANNMATHHAIGMWLINYIVNELNMDKIIMPPSFSCADWYSPETNPCHNENNNLYHEDKKVAFVHHKFNKKYNI